LKAAGYTPHFIAPSTMNASNAVPYFNDATSVSGAANLFTMLSYHRYGGGDYSAIYQAAHARGVQTGMLEFFTASVDDLLQDLTVANVSAWEKYAIASPKQNSDYAYLYADVSNPSNPVVSLGAKAAQMMPYFRFVRLGAVRVGATSNSGGIVPVAFVNPNGTNVVVVKGDGAALTVKGIRDAVYGVRSVAADGKVTNATDVAAANGVLKVTVPAGVTAIYDKDAIKGGGTSNTGGASGAGGTSNTGGNIGGAAPGSGGAPPSGGTTAAGGKATPGPGGSPSGGATGTGGKGGSAPTGSAGRAPDAGGRAGTNGGNGPGKVLDPDGGAVASPRSSDASGCGCRMPRSGSESTSLGIIGVLLATARLARSGRRRPR
jgi:hypothetical protein